MGTKIRFDEDLVSANAQELDKIARRFAKAERRQLYMATMVKRLVKELDLCERYGLKLPGFGPNTATFDDDPQTVHLAISGDHCCWTFLACGGDADEGCVDGVQVEYGHKSKRTVNCPACLDLMKRAEVIRAKPSPAIPAVAATIAPVAAPAVDPVSTLPAKQPANPFYAGKRSF